MKIDDNASIKELEALKRRIEKKISTKQSGKEDYSKFYDTIKNDHARHRGKMDERFSRSGRLS